MKHLAIVISLMLFINWNLGAQERDTVVVRVGNDTTIILVKSKIDTNGINRDVDDDMISPEDMDDEMASPESSKDGEDEFGFTNSKPKKKNVKTRWVMVDYGFSTYTGGGSLNLPEGPLYDPFVQNLWKSSDWNLHVFKMKINMLDHKVNFMYGLSFEFYRYAWTKNYDIPKPGTGPITPIASGNDYKKNRMYTSWLSLPVMLNFETNTAKYSKSFHINVGVFGSVLLASNIKQETRSGEKSVVEDDYNLNQYRYGLTGQVGYGPINFFVNYALNPLFKTTSVANSTQPELYPLNFGICLIPF